MSSSTEPTELDEEDPSDENLRVGDIDTALEKSVNDDPMSFDEAPLWEYKDPLKSGDIPDDPDLEVLELPSWPG